MVGHSCAFFVLTRPMIPERFVYWKHQNNSDSTMETNVTLNISLTLKAQSKTQEEIEGAAYWLLQPFLEQFTGENTIGEIAEGITLKDFDITVTD